MKFNSFLERLSEYFGYDSNYSNLYSDNEIQEKIKANISKYDSFAHLLSYKYFDEENKIFISDNSIHSMMFKLSPLVGINENSAKFLENFLANDLPSNSFLTLTLVASSNIQESIDFWKSLKNMDHNLIKRITLEREVFLNKKSVSFSSEEKIIPRNFRLYLSYSQKVKNRYDSDKFKHFTQSLLQKLRNLSLHPQIADCNDLIEIVSDILEINIQKTKEDKPSYNSKIAISEQITTPLYMHQVKEDRIEHEESNLTSKMYFVKSFPKEFSLEYMIKLLGDDSEFSHSISGRFVLSHTIANNINSAESSSLLQKGNRIIDASEQWYSKNNRNIIREAAQWRDVSDKVKNGDTFLTEFFQIMLTCDSKYIEEAEQNLFSLYHSLDWKLAVNKYLSLPAFLSILPMQSHLFWRQLRYFMLSKVALSSEAAAKLPIHAEWKGVPKPVILLMGRRGQLFHWNPFYRLSSGNYNICIFGPSGSGKSVFLQELAVNLIAVGTKVFILDIGKSFKNICNLLGGEIIEFGSKSKIVSNPFCKFSDNFSEEDRDIAILYAKNIICSMCSACGDPLKELIIEKTILYGLESYNSSIDLTKFANILAAKENCEISKNLALSLFSYTESGIYGKFFSKNANKQDAYFDKDITIFEFEEIKNNPLLLSVVLQIIGMQIFMQALTGNRDRNFMLIVDEAWMILEKSAKFLAEFARTIRKYGGSLAVCVQNFSDLQISEQRKAILQNSTWTILLKQDEKGINSFQESEAFKNIIPLIKSLSIEKNTYAEMLIYSTGIQVVGRLVLDNFSKILYSTDSEIFAEIRRLEDSGMKLEEAIEKIVRDKNE